MKFSLKEILEATGAKVLKNETQENDLFTFSTDTRTIKEGEIYLPLKGENFNGENFIDKALEVCAIGFFCTKDAKMQRCKDANIALLVEDTLIAYLELARYYKRKINPKTVAITGSSGKTTTKEMAYCMAKEKFKTHKSELNFNNEIGLCKTILSMPQETEVLILEMGMRGLGEIELLSKYAEPDIAIITNVGSAHLGRLGSRDNIAKAKCEVTSHLKENGVLIAHDDELIKTCLCEEYEQRSNPKSKDSLDCFANARNDKKHCCIYFSLNDTKILDRKIGYSKFEYKNHIYELNIEGDYNIQNSLAVIEMGLKLGMKEFEINSGLKKYSPIEKRWELKEVKGYKIINDSYNANPESMKAAIKTFIENYPPPLLIVLGDMGELGKDEIKLHEEIGNFLVKTVNKKANIITVGKLANEITKRLKTNNIESKNFENNLQISRYILDNIKFGTTIVLKASRSMKLEEIITNLENK